MKKLISLSAAAVILAGSMAVSATADARPGYRGGYGHNHAGGYRRHGRNGAIAGAAVAGVAGALIAGAIAQSQARSYDRGYGYEAYPAYRAPAYGYGPDPYGY